MFGRDLAETCFTRKKFPGHLRFWRLFRQNFRLAQFWLQIANLLRRFKTSPFKLKQILPIPSSSLFAMPKVAKNGSSGSAGTSSPRAGRVQKKKREKDAPKRALNAYVLFSNDKRDAMKKEHPDWSAPEIMKALAKMWSEAGQDVKEKYHAKAVKDKQR
jgi:hypothetical protein